MSSWDYFDFELEIRGEGPRDYLVAVRSPAGEAQAEMRFPFDEWELKDRLQALEIALLRSGSTRRRMPSPEEHTVQDFGQSLFEALLVGDVRTRYEVSLSEARRRNKGLRLKLHIRSPELAVLPWEFLYDAEQDRYLSLSATTPLVRYLDLPRRAEPLTISPPLRVLGMVASPTGLDPLDVEHEKRLVEEATRGLRADGLLELTWLEGQTWRHLQRTIRHGPWHVFHFVGHGGFDPATEEGAIALADEAGRKRLLRATSLAELLDDHYPLRLVFLNSCEGARGSESDAFSSTAATLVRRGIPAVVAMQYEITDKAAIEFSRDFYEAVADGLPVDAAVTEARAAVSMDSMLEWGTPVLYMRSPDGRVFDVPTDEWHTKSTNTTEQTAYREEHAPLRQYRKSIESAWADRALDRNEAEQLRELKDRLGLIPSAAADIEREVMGHTIEAIPEPTKGRSGGNGTAVDTPGSAEPGVEAKPEEPVSPPPPMADTRGGGGGWRKVAPWALAAISIVAALALVLAPRILRGQETLQVPSLEGQQLAAARQEVGDDFELVASEERGSDKPKGVILDQDLEPGAEVPRGEEISVVVSTGPKTMQLPNVVGKSREEAEKTLVAEGFEVRVKTQASSEADIGKVVGQFPSGGEAKKGSEVKITVGQAPKPPPGFTLVEDATGRLTVEVPSDWETMTSENVTVKVLNMEGSQIDQEEAGAVINAAPDLDNWQHSAAGSGTSLIMVEELAQSYTNDELIDGIPALSGHFADCSPGTRENLSRASYSGRVQRWNDCYAHTPSYVTLAAAPKSRECAVVGQIGMITEADREAAQHILDTFEVDCGAIASIGPGNQAIVNIALADEHISAG